MKGGDTEQFNGSISFCYRADIAISSNVFVLTSFNKILMLKYEESLPNTIPTTSLLDWVHSINKIRPREMSDES